MPRRQRQSRFVLLFLFFLTIPGWLGFLAARAQSTSAPLARPAASQSAAADSSTSPAATATPEPELAAPDQSQAPAAGFSLARLWTYAGKYHPMVVHFPIAMLIGALLAEMLRIAFPSAGFASTARFCLWIAALSAPAAVALGWSLASDGSLEGDASLEWHRWLGVSTAVVIILALLIEEISLRPGRGKLVGLYRALLLVAVGLISVTGHLGATMVFGADYFKF